MNDYQIKKCLSKINSKCFDMQEPDEDEFNDIDNLQTYLEARQKVEELSKSSKLKDYSYISNDLIELCKSHKKFYQDIFHGSEGPYKVELSCKLCGNKFIRELCKGKIYSLIENKVEESDVDILFCESCAKTYVEQDLKFLLLDLENEAQEENERRLEVKSSNTKYYIDNFLNPDKSWKETCQQKDRFADISIRSVDRGVIGKHIKSMSYSDFLSTPYWKAISQQAKYYADFKCQLCGSKNSLNTHHKTYEHHGEELQYIKKDLIVLCKDCHEKFHDITD